MAQSRRFRALWCRSLGRVIASAVVVAACGSPGDSRSQSTDAQTPSSEPSTADPNSSDTIAVFDASRVHEFTMSYDDDAYDAMIKTFSETGEKEWIEVRVTIDGVTYEHAGARLKGNSSLAALSGRFRQGPKFHDDQPPEDAPTTSEGATAAPPLVTSTVSANEQPPRGGPSGMADADVPQKLPWLIRLDEFVDGQEHQGYEDFVVRSNGSATSLNEAVALDLLDKAGLASQKAVAASFAVNDGEPALRLVIENPDDDAWYESRFEGDGALYKAESTGDWRYRGSDIEDYEEVFDQEGGTDITDLSPLIDFLWFINESDDESFAKELPLRLDVNKFAVYLAMMDLLANIDDIDGPGNNAYLWYDVASEQFTIVPWDMNLALGSGFARPGDVDPDQVPPGVVLPDAGVPGEPPARPNGGPGPGFGQPNILVIRFHANAQFEQLYQQAVSELRSRLYKSGVASDVLSARVATLNSFATALVAGDVIAQEAQLIEAHFTAEPSAALGQP